MKFRLAVIILLGSCLHFSCYSFKGTSISTDVNSFFVGTFRNSAGNAPADIAQIFSDQLRDKVLRESRLDYSEYEPHLEFNGSVSSFQVTSVAPSSEDGQIGSSLNRLSITVRCEMVNQISEEDSFNETFQFFADFDATLDLFDLQEELIETIFDQITEDIFNRAFSNW